MKITLVLKLLKILKFNKFNFELGSFFRSINAKSFFNPEITFKGDEKEFNKRIFGEEDRGIINDGGDSILKAYQIIYDIDPKIKFKTNSGESNDLNRTPLFKINKGSNNIPKEGVPELFGSSPELANIGTQEQYSEYLDAIFPDSKVKDIKQHVTESNFEFFTKEGNGRLGKGFYFSDFR